MHLNYCFHECASTAAGGLYLSYGEFFIAMISRRGLLLYVLSVACVATFLYYTVLPQGPHLLNWTQGASSGLREKPLETSMGGETTLEKSEKFDPE